MKILTGFDVFKSPLDYRRGDRNQARFIRLLQTVVEKLDDQHKGEQEKQGYPDDFLLREGSRWSSLTRFHYHGFPLQTAVDVPHPLPRWFCISLTRLAGQAAPGEYGDAFFA
ncbi:MAG: hypothetical protein H0Z34_16205 [Brevibacillus sp.]|nr:hypothetical protein [Brevibacillus sp.]